MAAAQWTGVPPWEEAPSKAEPTAEEGEALVERLEERHAAALERMRQQP